jgi:hypothetical protein
MKKRDKLTGKKIHAYKHCCREYSRAELNAIACTLPLMYSTKKYATKQYTLDQVSQIVTFIINSSAYPTTEALVSGAVNQLFYTGYFKLKWHLAYDKSSKCINVFPEVIYNSSIFSLYHDYLNFGLFGTNYDKITIHNYSVYEIAFLLKSDFAGSFFSTLPLNIASPIRLSLNDCDLTKLTNIDFDKTKVFSPKDIIQILRSLEHALASAVMTKQTMTKC